jgi:drug/metabolite transporter (DMT)-like permease
MGLDIRWPIGLMFSLIGAMLTITGLITNSNAEMYQRSLGKNVNLWWGLLLVVFGAFMLVMAMLGSKPSTGSQPDSGQKPGQPGNPPQK